MSVVCWQVAVPASGLSLDQRSPTDCGASEWDRDASIMGRLWPTGGLSSHGGTDSPTNHSNARND